MVASSTMAEVDIEKSKRMVNKDELISKLKGDGNFDKLRLNVIRRIKQDEKLRDTLVSTVKQSKAIKNAEVEGMKPQELYDAIHAEVGEGLMALISDALWSVIKSSDGMGQEIRDTVQSVYNRLVYPEDGEKNPPAREREAVSVHVGPVQDKLAEGPPVSVNSVLPSSDPKEPPGFLPENHHCEHVEETRVSTPSEGALKAATEQKICHHGAPPGFVFGFGSEQCEGGEEDLDVPPGFG